MPSSDSDSPWYRDGLAFTCTRCGACCTGGPGYVWVSAEEIEDLARFRGEKLPAFSKKFVRRVGDRHSLIECPGGDCIFWNTQEGCTVYLARPVQCRTWPFWPENVETPEDWQRTTAVCPGSGQGRSYKAEQIIECIGMIRP